MTAVSSLSGKRVLLTGATGFIGSHLSRALRSRGVELHCLSRRMVSGENGEFQWHFVDLGDLSALRRTISLVRPEVVFHLASRVTGSRDLSEVLPTLQSNLTDTIGLLTLLTGTECRRVVLAGSLEEISSMDESPCSPYAAAKSAVSCYAKLFHSLYSLPVVTARLFMVYGPGQKDSAKLVPYVVESLLAGRSPRLTSGVRPVDWIFVDDVVEGLLRMSEVPGIEGRTVDLGSGKLTSVRELVELIQAISGSTAELKFGTLPDRPAEKVAEADLQRTFELLGWRPSTTLRSGLERTVAWYRSKLDVQIARQG